jgi:hypothetical protein
VLTDAPKGVDSVLLVAILAGLGAAVLLMPTRVQAPVSPRAHAITSAPPPAFPAPGARVALTVVDEAPQYAWSLARALQAWNESGASVHFSEVRSPRAKVRVVAARNGPCSISPDVAACTERGHDGPRTIWIIQHLDRYDEAEVLVHELGHVIGLGHDTSGACVAMATSLWQGCEQPPVGDWRCRLLSVRDVAAAAAVVGGIPVRRSEPIFCRRGA